MPFFKNHCEFLTVTCLNWQPLLKPESRKQIITDSFQFLVSNQRVEIFSFVLMDNHFHLIWCIEDNLNRPDVQRDFLRFTSQQILKEMRNDRDPVLEKILVNAKDRKYQVWERNSLSTPLDTPFLFDQKLEYIHDNPVKAGLSETPESYRWSSSAFYELGRTNWTFLTRAD